MVLMTTVTIHYYLVLTMIAATNLKVRHIVLNLVLSLSNGPQIHAQKIKS